MTNANDSLFPKNYSTQFGLTKREYFAAMALQGICANNSLNNVIDTYACDAVALADALINELNKQP